MPEFLISSNISPAKEGIPWLFNNKSSTSYSSTCTCLILRDYAIIPYSSSQENGYAST